MSGVSRTGQSPFPIARRRSENSPASLPPLRATRRFLVRCLTVTFFQWCELLMDAFTMLPCLPLCITGWIWWKLPHMTVGVPPIGASAPLMSCMIDGFIGSVMCHWRLIHNDVSTVIEDIGQCCSLFDATLWHVLAVCVERDLEGSEKCAYS